MAKSNRRGTTSAPGNESAAPPRPRGYKASTIAWVITIVSVALIAVYAFGGAGASSSTSANTTSTYYIVDASSVIQAAVAHPPEGYTATSSGSLKAARAGEANAAYATLSEPQSSANVTVLVFTTTNSSQSYYDEFASNVQGIAGYTDISGVLSGLQRYGHCYAYGEDVDGIAVANGICRDGNVFLEAHLSSSGSLSQLEEDLSGFMGAMYQSVR